MALALANRAACLQKAKQYELALRDLQLSLSYGYPDEKRYKILERKGHCLLGLLEEEEEQQQQLCRSISSSSSSSPVPLPRNTYDEGRRLGSSSKCQKVRNVFETALTLGKKALGGEEKQKARFIKAVEDALQKIERYEKVGGEKKDKASDKSDLRHHFDTVKNPHPRFPVAEDCFELVHEVQLGPFTYYSNNCSFVTSLQKLLNQFILVKTYRINQL